MSMLQVKGLKAWYGAAQILIDVKGWLEQDLRGPIPCLEAIHLEHAHGRASVRGR